jgi:chorismate mutase/prephenate dehydratase
MDPKGRLNEIRTQLGAIDRQIARLLEERAKLSKEVRQVADPAGTHLDGEREQLARFLEEQPEGELPRESLRAIFGQIAAASVALARPVRVAYLGPEGGFCHQMASIHFGHAAVLIECATVGDALEEVRRQRAAFCTFPFDSSVDGTSVPTVTALAETDLVLVGERTLPAILSLMNAAGDGKSVARIYSTSAGHAASERFRKREFSYASVVDVKSPLEAVRRTKEDPESAAVVPESYGRDAELAVVKENVGDEPELRVRYGIVGTRPASRTGNDTTSLLFSLDDTPGTLFQVLGHFAERGINLKKIQSRPVRGTSWAYIFYVEVSGHQTDRAVVTALEAVKASTKYLKLLGSFASEA